MQQINALLAGAKPGKAVLKPAAAVSTVAVPAAPQEGRRRKKFARTGEQSILAFIRERKNPTTKQINAHWEEEGRGSTADSLLGQLVKDGVLKRTQLGGKLGSEYSLASAASTSAATPSTTSGKASKPHTYATTAEQLILNFVKEEQNPTTQEIKKLWAKEGRKGKVDNALTRLIQARKLKRTPIVGGRGSRYSIP